MKSQAWGTVPCARVAWSAWTARGCPWTSERAIGANTLTCSGRPPPSTLTRPRRGPHPAAALGSPTAPEPWAARRLRGAPGLARRPPGAERRPAVQAGPPRRHLAARRVPGAPHRGPLPGGADGRGRPPGRSSWPGCWRSPSPSSELGVSLVLKLVRSPGAADAEDPPRRPRRRRSTWSPRWSSSSGSSTSTCRACSPARRSSRWSSASRSRRRWETSSPASPSSWSAPSRWGTSSRWARTSSAASCRSAGGRPAWRTSGGRSSRSPTPPSASRG